MNHLGLLLLFLFSVGLVSILLILASVLGPKRKTTVKDIPFECGAEPVGSPKKQRFSVRFYLVAMVFILFDVEIIFLYPWAVNLYELSWKGFYLMFSFVFVLSLGLVYIIKNGVLDWNK